MSSIIPNGCTLVHDAVEMEGRDLFPHEWTGEEWRERNRVLDIMAISPAEQVKFGEAAQIGQTRQSARDRLMTAYHSLCKKLEDGRRTAVVIGDDGTRTAAQRAIFASANVWKVFAAGIAPIDVAGPGKVGEFYVEELTPTTERPKNVGGRPRLPWDDFYTEVIRIANTPNGIPETQAELERIMSEWCGLHWSTEPGESTIRQKVSAIYAAIRRGQKLT